MEFIKNIAECRAQLHATKPNYTPKPKSEVQIFKRDKFCLGKENSLFSLLIGAQIFNIFKQNFQIMHKKAIFSNSVTPPVGPYSQAISVGNMLFISGQIAPDAVSQGLRAECEAVMASIDALLKEAGFTRADVVKTTILLADMVYFAQVNEVYAEFFQGEIMPARETFAVKELPKQVNVEISVIAVKG